MQSCLNPKKTSSKTSDDHDKMQTACSCFDSAAEEPLSLIIKRPQKKFNKIFTAAPKVQTAPLPNTWQEIHW
jgi:hypothetical protein